MTNSNTNIKFTKINTKNDYQNNMIRKTRKCKQRASRQDLRTSAPRYND